MNDLEKYLGVLIIHNKASRHTFQFIFDKLNQRLNSWKSRKLSLVVHITFTKSALAVVLSYTMQTMFLPKLLYDDLDKMQRFSVGVARTEDIFIQ